MTVFYLERMLQFKERKCENKDTERKDAYELKKEGRDTYGHIRLCAGQHPRTE